MSAVLPALLRRRQPTTDGAATGDLVCRPGRPGWAGMHALDARRRGVGYLRADTWTLHRKASALVGAARAIGIDVSAVYRDSYGARHLPSIPALLADVRGHRREALVVPSLEVLSWGQPWGDPVTVVRVLAQQYGCEVVDLAWDAS